ncbi:MAG: aquaporin [Firmicutes bacterium]|nr:aquaporin [Bacillota bacterium]
MKLRFKKYIAEAIGTCVLVFVACGVAVFSEGDLVATALAFGLVLIAMAYSIGNISGCHINPAVSLGALITKKIDGKDFLGYVVAQIIGAIIGGTLLFGIAKLFYSPLNIAVSLWEGGFAGFFGNSVNHYAIADTTAKQIILSLIVEIALTFIFVLTILGVTSKKGHPAVAGIAIGLALTVVHLLGINLTGTSVNPARSLGIAIFGGADALKELWAFIVAPLAGAALAGLAGKYLFYKDKKEDEALIETK